MITTLKILLNKLNNGRLQCRLINYNKMNLSKILEAKLTNDIEKMFNNNQKEKIPLSKHYFTGIDYYTGQAVNHSKRNSYKFY